MRYICAKHASLGKISVNTIRIYAHHGCLKEETAIGSDYTVAITVEADLENASKSDDLAHTVDYVHINHIVKQEMAIPSKLLEHVAKRILGRVFKEMEIVTAAEVAVSKLNPPIGGDVAAVTITLKENRN